MKSANWWVILVAVCVAVAGPCLAQGARGKTELKAGSGTITVDYGRPSLKGRDMLSQLKEGDSWRMGANQATTLSTPVDLSFGETKIAAGSYSLFLARGAGDQFHLVLNSQTGQWGTQHDPSKDVAKVAMKQGTLPNPVETFMIELKPEGQGGSLVMHWGTTELTATFTMK